MRNLHRMAHSHCHVCGAQARVDKQRASAKPDRNQQSAVKRVSAPRRMPAENAAPRRKPARNAPASSAAPAKPSDGRRRTDAQPLADDPVSKHDVPLLQTNDDAKKALLFARKLAEDAEKVLARNQKKRGASSTPSCRRSCDMCRRMAVVHHDVVIVDSSLQTCQKRDHGHVQQGGAPRSQEASRRTMAVHRLLANLCPRYVLTFCAKLVYLHAQLFRCNVRVQRHWHVHKIANLAIAGLAAYSC
jgi:hypothetical protein